LQLEVIHHVGKRAEHEQQNPDPQIQADWMLLAAFAVRGMAFMRPALDSLVVYRLIHAAPYHK
jgi:hypothetical protein